MSIKEVYSLNDRDGQFRKEMPCCDNPIEKLVLREDLIRLRLQMKTLTRDEQKLIYLRWFLDFTYERVGKEFGKSARTIHQALSIGRFDDRILPGDLDRAF